METANFVNNLYVGLSDNMLVTNDIRYGFNPNSSGLVSLADSSVGLSDRFSLLWYIQALKEFDNGVFKATYPDVAKMVSDAGLLFDNFYCVRLLFDTAYIDDNEKLASYVGGSGPYISVPFNPFNNFDQVVITSATTLPNGLNLNTVYYVVNFSSNEFQLSLTPNGAPINFTGTGTNVRFTKPINTIVNCKVELATELKDTYTYLEQSGNTYDKSIKVAQAAPNGVYLRVVPLGEGYTFSPDTYYSFSTTSILPAKQVYADRIAV